MTKENKKRVAAVVVTYNRKELLKVCLEALLNQTHPLDALFIIDNASTDGTPEYLMDKGYLDGPLYPDKEPLEVAKIIPLSQFPGKLIEVHYVRMHENTGGAGGFHAGVKRAYTGFDWLWLMDDDVKADTNCLENLLDKNELIKNVSHESPAALACARFYSESEIFCGERKMMDKTTPFIARRKSRISEEDLRNDFLRMEAVTFEGMLVNTQHIAKVGFPDRRFFIHVDDYDYCSRLLKFGHIYYIPSAKLIRLQRQRASRKYTWKSYYCVRNSLYMDLKYVSIQKKIILIPYRLLRLTLGRLYHLDIQGIPTIFKSFLDAVKMYRQECNYFD